jgi:hypothetical protein
MGERMTDEQLRLLLEAATPGPWASDLDPTGTVVTTSNGSRWVARTSRIADADLVASFRDLGAEVLGLRAEIEANRAEIRALSGDVSTLAEALERANAEIRRMQRFAGDVTDA